MSIIRGPRPESNWYALDKRVSEDERLSWAARGLLIFLLGKPDAWKVSVEHLRKQTQGARITTGRDGIYALLTELQTVGYIQTNRSRHEDGTLGPVDYIVNDQPLPAQPDVDQAQPLPAQPDTAQPDMAETTLVKIEKATKTELSKKGAVALELPDFIPADAWADWDKYRKSRKGWTDKAKELCVRKLQTLHEQGHDPVAVIEQSIENGWAGLFPTRKEARNETSSRMSPADRVFANIQRAREDDAEAFYLAR